MVEEKSYKVLQQKLIEELNWLAQKILSIVSCFLSDHELEVSCFLSDHEFEVLHFEFPGDDGSFDDPVAQCEVIFFLI